MSLESGSAALTFDQTGPIVHTPWAEPAAGSVLVNGEPIAGPWRVDDGGGLVAEHGPWALRASVAGGAVTLEVRNRSEQPLHLETVVFGRWTPERFAPRLPTSDFRELVHNTSFLSPNAGVKSVGRKTGFLDFAPAGGMVTVYAHEGGDALLLGVLPPLGEAFSEFQTIHSEPHFEGDFGFEVRFVFGCVVEPGGVRRTSPVIAIRGDSGIDLLRRYGKLWRERLDRGPRKKPRVGWNSWDFYSGAVTRQAMNANLAAARRLFGDALECFVIDEGWECQWGTWEPNWKFPEGLEDFCRHVKAAGGIPGVWTAPLLVNTYNPLYLEHPEWFAARADGQVQIDSYSYGPMAYLDVTRDDVLKHLRGVFSRLRAAGFEYFKVDFCQCILKAVRFHDPTVGRNELVRRAFRAIRGAIGEDAYLLSCGAPYESVVGIADAARTTGDIHIYWGHVLRNAGAVAVRWWMAGNLWNGDPDFLVVRGPDTAEPPYGKRQVVTPLGPGGGWMAGREFNETEARAWALLVHLSGGDVILGDALDRLNATGREILRRVLKPRENAAVPVDLFSSEQALPRIWISRGARDVLVGIFNWDDTSARVDFDPADWGLHGPARDFWTDQTVEALPERMSRRSAIGLLYPA